MNQLIEANEGLALFQELDKKAALHLRRSLSERTKAFIALNEIRENAYYAFGGYKDWRSYFNDFIDHNGIGKSLAYDLLAVVRIARRCGWTDEDLEEYNVDTIKPWFERTGPILEYDRATGEITQIDSKVYNLLEGGDDLSKRYGSLVKKQVDAGEMPKLVRQRLRDMLSSEWISFTPFYKDGLWIGFSWTYENEGGEYIDGFFLTEKPIKMPDRVREEMLSRLRVAKEWR